MSLAVAGRRVTPGAGETWGSGAGAICGSADMPDVMDTLLERNVDIALVEQMRDRVVARDDDVEFARDAGQVTKISERPSGERSRWRGPPRSLSHLRPGRASRLR